MIAELVSAKPQVVEANAVIIVKRATDLQLYNAGVGEAAVVNQAVAWDGAWQPDLGGWSFPSERLGDLVLLLSLQGVGAAILDAPAVAISNPPLAALLDDGILPQPERYLAHAVGHQREGNAQLAWWVEQMRRVVLGLLSGALGYSEGQRLFLAANERMLTAHTDDEANAAIAVSGDLLAAVNFAITRATNTARRDELTLAGWSLGGGRLASLLKGANQ